MNSAMRAVTLVETFFRTPQSALLVRMVIFGMGHSVPNALQIAGHVLTTPTSAPLVPWAPIF